MFGNIGTFTAHGSRFNNSSGNQYNTNVATPGMLGPADPQWRGLQPVDDSMPVNRRAISAPAMFARIDDFNADGSTFNNSHGHQYNYNLPPGRLLDSVSAPATSQPPTGLAVPVVSVTHSASAPPELPAQASQSEITPVAAEARMFGSIGRLNTLNSEFNNSSGVQVNVHHHRPSSPSSFASFGNTDHPGPPTPPVPSLHPPNPRPPPVPLNPPTFPVPNPFLEPEQGPSEPSGSKPSSHKLKRKFFGRKKPDAPGDAGALALGVTDYVLTTLQNAARFSQVPFLPEAATAALSILQGIQGAKDNQGSFHRLAVHGCNLISSVALVYEERRREGRELAPELMVILQELVEKLRPVRKFVEEMHARHGIAGNFKKVILYKHEAAQVQEYREKLTQALAEFGLRSNISVQDGVAQIDKRLEDLVEAMNNIGLQTPSRRGTFLPSSPPISRPASTHSATMQVEPVPVTEEPVPIASGVATATPEVFGIAASSPASAPAAPPTPMSIPGFPFVGAMTPPPGSQLPWVNAMNSMFNVVGGNQSITTQVHNVTMSGGEYIESAARATSAPA